MTFKQEGWVLAILVTVVMGLVFAHCDPEDNYTFKKADTVLASIGSNEVVALPEGWVNTITHVTNYIGVNVFHVSAGSPARTHFKESELRDLLRSDKQEYKWLGKWLTDELVERRKSK